MSHLAQISTKHHIDKQYFNVSIKFQENPSGETICEFQEDRDVPILDKPDDWYMCISRFTIDGMSIPIFIMDVIPNPGDPTDSNFSAYSVTLTYFNNPGLVPTNFEVNLVYVPENNFAEPNPPVAGGSKSTSRYYYVFSYQHMIDMVNTALATAFADFRAAFGGASQTIAPFFRYDQETSLVSLITEFDFTETITDGGVTINRLQVATNDKLYDKCFEGIPSRFNGRNLASGADYTFNVEHFTQNENAYALRGNTIPAFPANDPDFLIFTQEGVTLDKWNDVIDIVFSTQSIPIYKEMIKSSTSPNGLPTFFSSITDFQPNLAIALSGQSILSFFQDGPYRLINLLSPHPMRTFDFRISWIDKLGNVIPLFITFNKEVSVRFCFFRKSSFTS